MQVTPQDESNERFILKLVRDETSLFKDIKFVQGKGVSIYDFWGYKDEKLVLGVDVKVRNCGSQAYRDYFISTDKIHFIKGKPELDFYIIFYFGSDKVLRMYDLRECSLEKKEISFIHKRTGRKMKQNVYTIPAHEHCFNVLLF